MRIIGLDVGTKTVGVALSDPLGITAQPFETITRKDNNKLRRTYARIEQIISEYDVTEIVVEADEVLEECGVKRENRKTVIDQIAAVFILRGYMESKQKN